MLKLFSGVVLLFSVFLFTGCLKEDKTVCSYNVCDLKAPESEIAAVKSYLDISGIEATKHCSGMYYSIVEPGSGDRVPDICSSIHIKYSGKFTDETSFDANTNGITFQLGNLIEGWKKGLFLIGKGGKINLYVPPTLGYGPRDYMGIPGNSILVFQIELIDFK